jgi:hypothetical protein
LTGGRSAGIGSSSLDEITVAFRLAPRHGRAGAKISIDSFELIPRH